LHRQCYPEASFDDVYDYLAWCLRQTEKGRIFRFVAVIEGQAVGNIQLTVWGDMGEVGSLMVAEQFRRKGLAAQLLTTAITKAKNCGLAALEISVEKRQLPILSFYERAGFHQIGETKKGLSHLTSPEPIVHLRMAL
jgi:GNAT superfamily N-acetyltransferase